VIDEITVEKQEVCEGEENLISVKAHTLDGTDADLHYFIGQAAGASAPIRSYRSPSGDIPAPKKITVVGRATSPSITVDVPDFKVKECKSPRSLLVGYRPLPNAPDEYEFQARLIEEDGTASLNPKQYRWSFGDGKSEVTSIPFAVHSYARRPEKTLYSQFLVQATAVGESGEEVLGRVSFQKHNFGYATLENRKAILLFSEGTPRFPKLDDQGRVTQTFRVWHAYDQSVEIQRVFIVREDHQGRRDRGTAVEPSKFLSDLTVPPGGEVEVEITLDTKQEPELFGFTYRLEGTSTDGKPAYGEATVLVPPPRPTRDNSTPIEDPRMVSRIQQALKILHQDTVSLEELRSLERAGRLH
jgi:hypothetical protein